MKKLTIKQKKFADEYIISGNATEAAVKAGYSKKTASVIGAENLIKPNIKSYLDERLEELEDKAIAKQDEILKYLTSVVRGEQTEQILARTDLGAEKLTNIQVSAKDRIKAAELLGKRYGSWTDKVDLTSNLTILFEDDYGD